jgi:hypothetical protein
MDNSSVQRWGINRKWDDLKEVIVKAAFETETNQLNN